MDFDPSEFLAMAMSEEQDSTYTAPDLPLPDTSIATPHNLPAETPLQEMDECFPPLQVPTFGTLEDGLCAMDDTAENYLAVPPYEMDSPIINVESPEPTENTNPSQPSPVDRTSSPHPATKKIPVTYEETRFRKEFFYGSNLERVKLFRLHCTICDRHLGCAPHFTERQMRIHKLLSVTVCRKCNDFYGDVNFPIEDDSEIYCCWCGQGGELYICSSCPKTVCKNCILRNFGSSEVKKIDENDNWKCFVCDPTKIFPHRAMIWGLHRYSREMRQKVYMLTIEEKKEILSRDTSHCCQNGNAQFPVIKLPFKAVMSKVPICLIADPHKVAVRNQPDPTPGKYIMSINANNNATQHTNQSLLQTAIIRTANARSPGQSHPQNPVRFPQQKGMAPTPAVGIMQHLLNKPKQTNGPVPYPASSWPTNHVPPLKQVRKPIQLVRRDEPSRPVQLPQRNEPSRPVQLPRRDEPNRFVQSPEIINLEENSSPVKSRPSQNNNKQLDIGWLEKGVIEVNHTLVSIKIMLDQFAVCKHELKNDLTRLTSFSDNLSHNIKIGICNLAKINQDMVDAKKIAIDEHVNSVVTDIKASVLSSETRVNSPVRVINAPVQSVNHNPPIPQTVPRNREQPTTPVPAPQVEEDMGEMTGLPAALLCETVMEVEGNKENENSNKHKSTPIKRPRPKPRSFQKGKPLLVNSRSSLQRQTIPVIDLLDDDEFDASFYCKKYKILPCKVVLTKLNPQSS